MLDVKAVHYSAEIWGEDAAEFRPERFVGREEQRMKEFSDRWLDGTKRHPMSFLTLGAGRRQCLGMRLGYRQVKLALANLLLAYKLHMHESTGVSRL